MRKKMVRFLFGLIERQKRNQSGIVWCKKKTQPSAKVYLLVKLTGRHARVDALNDLLGDDDRVHML